ncbi:hypothetical protein ACIFOT_05730 [Neobacillus sp. NRS-1170]|uniref:hypothetical protein n=1 Tax=Neobacillus sp. NRS-1170 TaxID=3233898 RepID=UPI003D2768F3
MTGALILIAFGFFFLLLGWIFWGMDEDTGKPFWVALLETLTDIFSDFLLASYRTVALIFWTIGLLVVVLGLISIKHPELLNMFFSSIVKS